MRTRIVVSIVLASITPLVKANTLSDGEMNMSKCAGYIIAVGRVSPEIAGDSADVARAKIAQVSRQSTKPDLAYLTMINTANGNADLISSFVKVRLSDGRESEVQDMTKKAVVLCKQTGLDITFTKEKMVVSPADIGDAL